MPASSRRGKSSKARFGGACTCHAGAEQDARDGDRPEVVVEGRLVVRGHPRAGLRAEVLDDDLLHVPVLLAERLQGEERVDPLLASLADPDEDPARERDRELAGEANRLEATRGDLVGRGPVRAAFRPEPLRGRLEHDPHRGRDGPQRFQLRARHDAGIEVRQQSRLLEHEPGAALEVLERRLAAERSELLARDLVAQLGLVAEREERFVAAGRRAGARDREHLVLGHECPLAAARWARERAVAANVTAQRRERDEDLRRVGDERPRAQPARLREQLLERRGEKVGGAHHPVASIRRDRAVAFVYEVTRHERRAMRFLFLIHGDAEAEAALAADERRTIVVEHIAYGTMLRERGAFVLGEALSGEAAVVRPGEKPFVTDGPFAETKEGVGGFYVVECASREEALELAGRVPRSPGVAVEVLGIAEM